MITVRTTTFVPRTGRDAPAPADALDLIAQEHATIRELFALHAETPRHALAARRDILDALLGALEAHSAVETDVFYPALANVLRDGNRLRAAFEAHIEILGMIRRARATPVDDPALPEIVAALREAVERHFDEEETHLFRGARDCEVDLRYVGHLLARRRNALDGAADDLPGTGAPFVRRGGGAPR